VPVREGIPCQVQNSGPSMAVGDDLVATVHGMVGVLQADDGASRMQQLSITSGCAA
jgi:hypothetical protein